MHADRLERRLCVKPTTGWTRVVALLLLLAPVSGARAQLTLDIHTGTSGKFITELVINQRGYPETTIGNVVYETKPWLPSASLLLLTQNYYDVRLGYFLSPAVNRTPGFGVELELLHDKIYYVSGDDPTGVVDYFELSDGVNYLLLNGVLRYPLQVSAEFPHGRLQLLGRLGFGPVISAPASRIRGQEHGDTVHGTWDAYEWAGLGVGLGAQLRYFVLPWLAASVETRYTYSEPVQSIANGTAQTFLPTLHFNFGLSIAF